MSNINEIVLATGNQGKLKELQQMLSGQAVTVLSLKDFPAIEEPEETGKTFADNARLKAEYYSKALNRVVLADDSGLEVLSLHNAPGVYSARFAGVDGDNRDKANNAKLLELLAGKDEADRKARFRCCLCLASPDEILYECDGQVDGEIIDEARGENGFGYDPIFLVDGHGKTAAELTKDVKNSISHRGNALKKLLPKLVEIISQS